MITFGCKNWPGFGKFVTLLFCGGKPGLSPLPLILTLILTLNPNPKDLTNRNPNPTYPNQPTANPSLPPQ